MWLKNNSIYAPLHECLWRGCFYKEIANAQRKLQRTANLSCGGKRAKFYQSSGQTRRLALHLAMQWRLWRKGSTSASWHGLPAVWLPQKCGRESLPALNRVLTSWTGTGVTYSTRTARLRGISAGSPGNMPREVWFGRSCKTFSQRVSLKSRRTGGG